MAPPLAGLRIVDLSQIVSGPMAATILADQGAEVIKVEAPGGDPVRGFGAAKGGTSAMFVAVNRGKRGLALDLKATAAADVLWRLIERADVLIENFRPGTMERLGFGWEACRARNPGLVFASINGFGADGPYANIRVYDPVIQAVSGLAATQTDAEGRPSLIKSLIADKVTALTAAQAITAALFHRERTGEGQRVEVAMLDAAIFFNWPDGMYNHSFLDEPCPVAPEYGALNRLRPAADGQVAIGVLQSVEFQALMRAVGLDHLADDPRFTTLAGRLANRGEWETPMLAAIAQMPLADAVRAFSREGAVGGHVNAAADVHADAQVVHNGSVVEIEQAPVGRMRVSRHPARFAATPAHSPRPAPSLGEHGADVLAELGYDAPQVARLVEAKAVRLPR